MDDGGAPACQACPLVGVARACDQGGQAASAIVYCERYLALPFGLRRWYDSADNGAVRRAAGSRRAMEHYGAFLDLWKDADPDLQPVVLQLRKRYAELVKQEGH